MRPERCAVKILGGGGGGSIGSYVPRKTLNLLNGLADCKIFSEI